MLRARGRGSGRGRSLLGACGAAAGLALILAACGPVSAGSSSAGTSAVNGGVATYATTPGFPVNYIFPFTSSLYFSVSNSDDFQYLMYRPLYWFGDGTKPYMSPQLSLAYPPTYKGSQVTIRLKPYQWSNGTPVTANDVVFWMNMMIAEKGNWGGYVPGDLPDDIRNVHAVGTSEVVMTITKSYSPAWFTDNELSQVTPMPQAWDRTTTGPSDCVHVTSDCVGVYDYLNGLSVPSKMGSWGSSKIWSIVDGPFYVTKAESDGTVFMNYNKRYSGSVPQHHISQFTVLPFTSEQAEFNVLQDPQGSQRVDVGYLPTVDAPVPPPGVQNGGNPVSLTNYKLTVVYPWQLSYFPYNFSTATDPADAAIFGQLYFRQAFQDLQDQEGVIDGPMHGYGKPTTGPVANYPLTNYLSPTVRNEGDLWELNPSKAEQLLQSHGWKIVVNGVDTCQRAGTGPTDCGQGIRAGAKLQFNLLFATGIDYMYSAIKELASNASLVGISITPQAETAQGVIGTVTCSPSPTNKCSPWSLAEWGSWTFSPDFLPTGEELFEDSIFGGLYNNPKDNTLINKTLTASASTFQQAMNTWQNYLAKQLPVVYTPDVPTLVESDRNLNIGPQSPTLTINPEDWYYLK